MAISRAATHFEATALPGDAVDELCDLGVRAHCCLREATSLETVSVRLTAWRGRHGSSGVSDLRVTHAKVFATPQTINWHFAASIASTVARTLC